MLLQHFWKNKHQTRIFSKRSLKLLHFTQHWDSNQRWSGLYHYSKEWFLLKAQNKYSTASSNPHPELCCWMLCQNTRGKSQCGSVRLVSELRRCRVYRIWLCRWGRGLCWTTMSQVFVGLGGWRTIDPDRTDTTWVCRNTAGSLTHYQLLYHKQPVTVMLKHTRTHTHSLLPSVWQSLTSLVLAGTCIQPIQGSSSCVWRDNGCQIFFFFSHFYCDHRDTSTAAA